MGNYPDSEKTNITVIEVNNAPIAETLGTIKVWTRGDNSTLYRQLSVTDVESGNSDSGNLTFNLTFAGEKLFNVSSIGTMNYTPVDDSYVGSYTIGICVKDKALANPHANISLCGQTGGAITVCQNFTLNITNESRPPIITNRYPLNETISQASAGSVYFNITNHDPQGIVPDAFWYVDNSLVKYAPGRLYDSISYPFTSGFHTVTAEVTNGLLNTSVSWNVTIGSSPPASSGTAGGSAGGVGATRNETKANCTSKWVCRDWGNCKNLESSWKLELTTDEYFNIARNCSNSNLNNSICGFQIRNCTDLNSCNSDKDRPAYKQECYFTENPSCDDKIKNCHDGKCEVLVDCGGPCSDCPTCSDGIKNQDEEGIDCGGVCQKKCESEKPKVQINYTLVFIILLSIINLVLLIFIIRLILNINVFRKELKG